MRRAGRRRIGPMRSGWPRSPSVACVGPRWCSPPEIRRLRDLTRYRRALVQDRTREQQRAEKLLEDAQIKISAVLSNRHGDTGRAIMDALIAGERDPRTLARLAKARTSQDPSQPKSGRRNLNPDRTHHQQCLVQLKIAIDPWLLLGFAIYVWTIPARFVQIYLAISVPRATRLDRSCDAGGEWIPG